jgi:hypothetical protein
MTASQPLPTGIRNISPLTALVAKVITAMVHLDKNADGKVSSAEWWSVVQFLFINGLTTIGTIELNKLKDEIKDLDKAEIGELVNIFSINHSLKDKELEGLIEDGLMLLATMANYVERIGNWKKGRVAQGAKIISIQRLATAEQLRSLAMDSI